MLKILYLGVAPSYFAFLLFPFSLQLSQLIIPVLRHNFDPLLKLLNNFILILSSNQLTHNLANQFSIAGRKMLVHLRQLLSSMVEQLHI